MRRVGAGLVFLTIVLSIWSGMHFFVWTHLARDTGMAPGARTVLAAALATFGISTFVSLLRILPPRILGPLWTAAFIWAGFVFLLFFLFVAGDIGVALSKLARPSLSALEMNRIEAVIAVTAAFMLGGWGWLTAARGAPVKRVEVTLDKLPKALSGFSIVQISDLHVSPDTRPERVQKLVSRVNALNPDLIALTGDLVDGRPEMLRRAVSPLAELKARHGAWFVTGNHEYFSGADRWIAEFQQLGFNVLQNQRANIGEGADSFVLAGVPDWRGASFGPNHQPRLAETLAGTPPDREVVLLAHQPRQFPEAAQLNVGLQLSGHTHGGQIWPFTWFIRLVERFVSGRYQLGRSQLYVSRGTGFWGPPMRLFAPSEITQIILHAV